MNSDTMIVTKDSRTATRIAVIGMRTESDLIAGAKAMMISDLKKQMRNRVAHFVYEKKRIQKNVKNPNSIEVVKNVLFGLKGLIEN